ncbi:MAG: hypothetical protein KDE26_14075 [Bacteroidetes bacterium]|nr:hypothetical protein [Bacteroidota bacterium]
MKRYYLYLLSALLLIAACAEEKQEAAEDTSSTPEITLSPLTGSPAFADATLSLTSATPAADGNYDFAFEVQNYELGAQTESNPVNSLANSGNGQHIHFIVDNSPYSAHYESSFSTDKLSEPGNHVVLAFLSRSYHESVKNLAEGASSYVIEQYQVGDGDAEEVDLSAPHMFYSRPKGSYKGDEIKRLLLDFFLLNVDLSPDGNKVRATINGTEFMIDKWQPYVIEGLQPGEVIVKLELLDAEGNLIDSPFNPVERSVTLEAATEE